MHVIMLRVYIFTIIAITLISCCREQNRFCTNGNVISDLFQYEEGHIIDILGSYGYTNVGSFNLNHSSNGTSLYVYEISGDNVFILKNGTHPKKISKPARNSFLNDKHEFVAWTDSYSEGVTFMNGSKLKLPTPAKFGLDPSGQLYYVSGKDGSLKIGTLKDPETAIIQLQPLEDEGSLHPHKMFIRDNKLYLFISIYGGDNNQIGIRCKVFGFANDSYTLSQEIDIPLSSSFIVDMDFLAENVLLLKQVDVPFHFLSSLYLFNLHTQEMNRISRAKAKNNVLFLAEDILSGYEVVK